MTRSAHNAGMSKTRRKRTPKTVLRLPDLEQSRSAVLNSLTSPSSQRAYDHAIRDFIDWYCLEPRLAFNKTVVTRYRVVGQFETAGRVDFGSIASSKPIISATDQT